MWVNGSKLGTATVRRLIWKNSRNYASTDWTEEQASWITRMFIPQREPFEAMGDSSWGPQNGAVFSWEWAAPSLERANKLSQFWGSSSLQCAVMTSLGSQPLCGHISTHRPVTSWGSDSNNWLYSKDCQSHPFISVVHVIELHVILVILKNRLLGFGKEENIT